MSDLKYQSNFTLFPYIPKCKYFSLQYSFICRVKICILKEFCFDRKIIVIEVLVVNFEITKCKNILEWFDLDNPFALIDMSHLL